MAANESLRFDLIGRDMASDAFSRVGRSVSDMSGRLDAAAFKSAALEDALKRQNETARRTADATLALAKSDEILDEVERRLRDGALEAEFALRKQKDALKDVKREADRLDGTKARVKVDVDRSAWSRIGALFGGGRGGLSGLFGAGASAAGGAAQGASGLLGMSTSNPYAAGGAIAAAITASPFIAQALSGAGIFALGGGLAGLGIAGAFGTGKAPSQLQLTAAQDRLTAAIDNLRKLQGSSKTAPGQLASAQASVAAARDTLGKLQASAIDPAQAKMRASFAKLADDVQASLVQIGKPFIPVMDSVLKTATSVLDKMTPAFAGAEKAISGPFKVFGDTLLNAFAQPAVKASIDAVAKSFGLLLKALTPQLGGDVAQVADGISRIARSVSDHPQAFADFVKGFFKIAGIALDGISALANFEGYLQQHFWPAVHRTAGIFDGARHDIAHVWDQIFENSVGVMIRLGHNIETQFSSMRHGAAVVFDGIRGDIAHYWDMTWNNTIGREQRGVNDAVHWLGTLPGKIGDVFKGAGTWLYGKGQQVISGFWGGLKNVWNSVIGWFGGLPSRILSALGVHSPPQWAVDAGKWVMRGVHIGMGHGLGPLTSFAGGLGSQLGAAMGAGSTGTEQRYAASLLGGWGWGQGQLGPLIALWNRESGWNPFAVNPSSGAYGIPQALGHGHPFSLGDWASQIRWGLAYIFGRYGSPAAAWAHEMSVGWYDRGGYLPPGLSLAYNGTGRPEPVGAAIPAGRGGDTYNVTVNVGPGVVNGREVGRQIAGYLGEFKRGGGWVYKPGGF